MGITTANLAEQMRRYIVSCLDEGVTPAQVAAAMGYSEKQCNRIFKRYTGKSMREYIRLLQLSSAAQSIQQGKGNILDIALSHQYNSHEGFTKAFSSAFGISPKVYRKGSRPIQYFIPYPVVLPKNNTMEDEIMNTQVCTATIVQRPARKLMMMTSKHGVDYWSFCQEKGCDWEGLLLSIHERMDIPAFLTLNDAMIPEGCALGAVGIEVPEDYTGEVPDGYVLENLPAGHMIYFQSPPYENEDDFAQAIALVFKAYEEYDPAPYGYAFDEKNAPVFNFGAFAEKGARIAVPVKPTTK